ncbi:MAG: hypothetical protein Kow0059_21560 [Candidatus Sumerlaeia bacterium]
MWFNNRGFQVGPALITALLLVCYAAPWSEATAAESFQLAGSGQCEHCHQQLGDARLSSPAQTMPRDIHGREGLGCADCHGGDAEAPSMERAHSEAMGFVGRPDPLHIPELCARCHSHPDIMTRFNPALPVDQWEKYKTSRHGMLLEMGLRKVATCASCHSAHNILPATDPQSSVYPVALPRTCNRCHGDQQYMAGFPIPTDQFAKYASSVHGTALLDKEDLGAPACNDCHGNHGAIPPGAQSLGHVCGICHALNAELFEKSPHAAVFAIQELPQCTVCHSHHAIARPSHDTFNMGADSVCITCHRPDDAGWRQGKKMGELAAGLETLDATARERLEQARQLGMDVTDGQFLLKDIRKIRMQLRTASHSLDMGEYEKLAADARSKLEEVIHEADSAIQEYHFRRRGLLVSVLLCLPVLLFLYLKIRMLDRGNLS